MKKLSLLKFVFAVFLAAMSTHSQAQLINLVDPTLLVNVPASVAGVKSFTKSNDGTTSTSNWGRAIDSFYYMVPLVKPDAADSLGCNPIPAGSMTNKFAMIFRGNCQFSDKALSAQNAGAIGIIIVNNIPGGPVGMAAGTVASSITIPVLMISQDDGAAINSQMWNGETVKVSLTNWGFGFAHDLGFVNNSLSLYSGYSVPKYELNTASQHVPYNAYTGAYVANFGSNAESNVKVKSIISFTPTSGSSSVLHTDSVLVSGTFNTTDSVMQTIGANGFSLPAITNTGTLKFDYQLSSSSSDDQPLNNNASFSVNVTDTIYSKCRINTTTGEPLVTIGYKISQTGTTDTWGPFFYIREGGHMAMSSQFTVSNGTSGTTEKDLSGGAVNIYAFKWEDLNADKFINIGELIPVGVAPKTFGITDSNYNIFTANYHDFNNSSKPLYLNSGHWYWFAAEVTSDLYLGCDGEINYFQRSNAASLATTPVQEYWAPQFYGAESDLISSDPNSTLHHFPFFRVTANVMDSIGFSSSKGLVPSINLRTSVSKSNGVDNVMQSGPEFSFYPNPANDLLNVKVAASSGNKLTARIMDGLGRIIFKKSFDFSQGEFSINTQGYQIGNYYLTIQEENGQMIAKKFVITK